MRFLRLITALSILAQPSLAEPWLVPASHPSITAMSTFREQALSAWIINAPFPVNWGKRPVSLRRLAEGVRIAGRISTSLWEYLHSLGHPLDFKTPSDDARVGSVLSARAERERYVPDHEGSSTTTLQDALDRIAESLASNVPSQVEQGLKDVNRLIADLRQLEAHHDIEHFVDRWRTHEDPLHNVQISDIPGALHYAQLLRFRALRRMYFNRILLLEDLDVIDREHLLIRHFQKQMTKGLDGQDSSLAMIDSHFRPATGQENGRFITFDWGGTNFRVLIVELNPDGRRPEDRMRILDEARMEVHVKKNDHTFKSADQLHDELARFVRDFLDRSPHARDVAHFDVGYVFSFAVQQTGPRSGKVTAWSKAGGPLEMLGKDPVQFMEAALRRNGLGDRLTIRALANDTIATYQTGRYWDPNTSVAQIAGTGDNKASQPVKRDNLRNFESGNYDLPYETLIDRALDAVTPNRGEHRLEKMTAGMYLGEALRLALKEVSGHDRYFAGWFHPNSLLMKPFDAEDASNPDRHVVTADLTAIAEGHVAEVLQRWGVRSPSPRDVEALELLGAAIVHRSAQLTAVTLAATILFEDPHLFRKHAISVDGSLYTKYPGYKTLLELYLAEVFQQQGLKLTPHQIYTFNIEEATGRGAAIIAAIAARQSDDVGRLRRFWEIITSFFLMHSIQPNIFARSA